MKERTKTLPAFSNWSLKEMRTVSDFAEAYGNTRTRRSLPMYQTRSNTRASSRFSDSLNSRKESLTVIGILDKLNEKETITIPYTGYLYKQKSIDNDKLIRGQPIDPRRNQVPTDQARAKHAQFMNKGRQDGRPKAAEVGKRLQSLPAKKENHASEGEGRPANSAPSKEQTQLNGPMPKINTFVSKEDQSNKKHEPQAVSSKQPDLPTSTVKTKEPVITKAKEPQTPMPARQSEQKADLKVSETVPHKPKVEDKPKVSETVRKVSTDKPSEQPRTEVKPTGVAGRSTQEDDRRKSSQFSSPVRTSPTKAMTDSKPPLPSDDHGPVMQTPKPAQSKQEEIRILSPTEENFKYYATEKKKDSKEITPRVQSDRSSKTDKSWTTIKTKTTEGKPTNFPDSPVKSYTTYNMSSTGKPANNMDNKRREVTIVDPKDARQYKSEEEREEAFLDEYEYSHQNPHRVKEFNEMDDEEKIEYFRDKLHMKPDQIRELTFHPKVTEPKIIHHTYTGVETVNWLSGRVKSGKRPKSKKNVYKKQTMVVPNQKKSVMLTRLQGHVYRHINKVYGASPRDNREKQFFERLAKLQLDEMQNRYEKLAERERQALESKFRQREQLKRLRKKFEDDSWRRFMTQYVTSKVVEAEYRDRHEYGLPNDINDSQSPYRSISRRKQQTLTPRRQQKKNQQKYSTIFRYKAGPIHKTVGKEPKFEGFDTVYIDTEDEQGKPTRKKQNVDALMMEAKRILDQSDGDDTDLEETPRKSRATPYRRPERSYKRPRQRKHISDDKSYHSSKTSRSKASSRPPPKTMKELMARRKTNAPQQPVNRYKASSFAAMKSDLLKDSAILNKNKKLPSSGSGRDESTKVPEPVVTEKKSYTPPEKTEQQRTQSPVKTNVVTKTSTEVDTIVTSVTNDGVIQKKTPEVSTYLDNMETQMAIDTARDKIDEPTPQPSHTNSRVDVKVEQKVASRTPSRVSYRTSQNSQDLSSQKDLQPPRAPSRISVATTESKIIDTVMKSNRPPQRRFSKSSIMPINEDRPSGSGEIQNSTKVTTKTETLVTETVKNNVNDPKVNGVANNETEDKKVSKTEIGSTISMKQNVRSNSVTSVKRPSRTTSVDIASTNGRMSPTIERKHESPHRKNSIVDRVSIRSMLANTDNKHRGSVSTTKGSETVTNGSPKTRTTVTKNVSTSEKVNETTNDITIPPKATLVRKDSKRSIYENEDILSTKKASINTKRSQSFNPNDKPRPTERPSKRKSSQLKKEQIRRGSRSPQRRTSQFNGHGPTDDVKVDREQYERLGHDGNRPTRNRSGSRDGSNRGRKRSTSGGRKKPVSKTRKRSLSGDRKKSNLKSRFPDIRKKDGEWKITARSPIQTVSRKENVTEDEYVTERVITPKPANQWQDLVSKYLRQPSPKIGKTEDRSILDSNMTDDEDDDDMDIFKRAQMRYKLNVTQTDDESDDD